MEQNLEQTGEIVMYQPDETVRLEVRMEGETVWLNRQQMASLFGRDVKTIGKHINNALKEELRNLSTVAKFAIVQPEGNRMIFFDGQIFDAYRFVSDLIRKAKTSVVFFFFGLFGGLKKKDYLCVCYVQIARIYPDIRADGRGTGCCGTAEAGDDGMA